MNPHRATSSRATSPGRRWRGGRSGAVPLGVVRGAADVVLCGSPSRSSPRRCCSSGRPCARLVNPAAPGDDDDLDEEGASRRLEARKNAALRALKDIAFERSIGRLGEEDYKAARAEATAPRPAPPWRAIDEGVGPGATRAEALLDEAERRATGAPAAEPCGCAPPDDAPPDDAPGEVASTASDRACPACGTRNDADAVFCKRCGARVEDEVVNARLEVTPRGGRFVGALTALLLTLASAPLRAQDAGAQGDPHPGPVAPDAQLPPGHPQVAPGANPHGASELNRADVPRTQVEERDEVPAGEVEAQVVDARGNPVPEALVRLGTMQGGEPGPAVERRASPNGVVRFVGLATGQSVAYRLSVEREGVRFSATPFQLTARRGVRAQLVRYEVSRDARGTLLWDARFELHFRDERLTVVQRMRIVNLSAMSLGGVSPEPRAFAPEGGLRFRLPPGYTAFQTAPMMADVRVEDRGRISAVLRGALAPTTESPLDVVFQYQLRLGGGDFSASRPPCRCRW
jgi:hypothetical protein